MMKVPRHLKAKTRQPQRLGLASPWVVAWLMALSASSADAQSLGELWEKMTAFDPTLLGAVAQTRAAGDRVEQARGALLPQIQLTANTAHNARRYSVTGEEPATTSDRYNSNGMQLSISQALIKRAESSAHAQSRAALEQAVQQLQATKQEMLLKLVTTWAEALYARDALKSASAVERVTARQLGSTERGFALGIFSLSQRDDARARMQQAIADRHTAESEQVIRHAALQQLVGQIPELRDEPLNVQPQRIPYGSLPDLSQTAQAIDDTHPGVLAAMHALRVAREETTKQSAAYWPTLELVASHARNNQPSTGTTPSQAGYRSRVDSVSVQLSVPLYSGGVRDAKVREAVNLEAKARFDVELARRTALSAVHQGWSQLRAAQAKLESAEASMTAGQSALSAARAGLQNGTKTPTDELDAQRMIETAARDIRRAYYDNVINMARVWAATGRLEEYSLEEMEHRMLQPTQIVAAPAIRFVLD